MSNIFSNNYIIQNKSLLSPIYYQLNEGFVGKICTFNQTNYNNIVYSSAHEINYLALFVLGIPVLLGLAVNAIIYSVLGEKIKPKDYNQEFDAWMQKKFVGREFFMKAFVDFCIANRIKATDCSCNHIILRDVYSNNPVYLFEADGCAGGALLDFTRDKGKKKWIPQKDLKALILWNVVEKKDEKIVQSKLESSLQKKLPPFPATTEFRKYYKIKFANETTVTSGAINVCNFASFNMRSVGNAKTIEHIRSAMQE